jgi:hypothetical protein
MISAWYSKKHRPNVRKRPYSEVATEFPSLQTRPLFAHHEFAAQSQAALISVGSISPTISSVFLPLISPHRLQRRFHVGVDDSVLVIMRTSYPILKKVVDNFNGKGYLGLHLRGPPGVGRAICCIFWLPKIA